jgi:general stress protein 26
MTVHISEDHTKLADQLSKHNIGILATTSTDLKPHAATIYFVTDADFNMYFITRTNTTKCRNLQQNPQAALAIFEAATQKTVQVVGHVSKVEDTAKFDEIYKQIMAITHNTSYKEAPPFSRLEAGGDTVIYCLKPQSLRLAEYIRTQQQTEDGLGIFDTVEIPPATAS